MENATTDESVSAGLAIKALREKYGKDCDLVSAAKKEAMGDTERLQKLLQHVITNQTEEGIARRKDFHATTEALAHAKRAHQNATFRLSQSCHNVLMAKGELEDLARPQKGILLSAIAEIG